MGEPVPGGCIPNALPVDNSLAAPWAPDVRCLWEALQGLLAEVQAKEGGESMVEEDKEKQRGPSASGVVPL